MSRSTSKRQGLRCPRCAGKVTRVPRGWIDRLHSSAGLNSARFACRDAGCGWKALMLREEGGWANSIPRLGTLRRKLSPALAALAAVGVAAVAWTSWRDHQPPPTQFVEVGPRLVARGVSYDGDALPADHPVMLKAVWRAEAATPAPASAQSSVPLAMRRHCAWGQPGRNPYKGTVEQALRSAYVPESVIVKVAADITARRVLDRVRIGNDTIVAERSGRRFDPHHVAMTYGMTLCADTRVNFKPGHVERADLFEARAEDGRKYSVMVPDVCGNVSVLAETADADDREGGAGDGSTLSRLPDELVYRDSRQQAGPQQAAVTNVPAPGTLALAALGLVLAVRLARRRP